MRRWSTCLSGSGAFVVHQLICMCVVWDVYTCRVGMLTRQLFIQFWVKLNILNF